MEELMAPGSIVFLTMENREGFFVLDHLAIEPLARLNWRVVEIPWSRAGVCWDDYAAVVIRSPWDYQQHCDRFLQVLADIDRSRAVLLNGLDVVRWNITKTYLRELEERGVPTVPTLWFDSLTERELVRAFDQLSVDELVIKPVIGANADDTYRVVRGGLAELRQQVLPRYHQRTALVQPFLSSIIEAGECSLFYFGGRYSHAVLKVPAAGDFRVQEEHGGIISAVEPTEECRTAAERAMEAVPFPTLYARVDLAQLPNGQWALMELELIEPSLYFPYDEQSPERFARTLDEMLRERLTDGPQEAKKKGEAAS